MKRKLFSLILALVLLITMAPVTVHAGNNEGFVYKDNGDGTCTITSGPLNWNVVIPAKLNGLEVSRIGSYAFDGRYVDIAMVTSVSIPNTVVSIGDCAFAGNEIESIDLPDSVFQIGDGAFSGNLISNADLGNGLVSIGDWAFYGNRLSTVQLPDTLVYIGSEAFASNMIENLVLPNNGTWKDGLGNTLVGGSTPTNLSTYYDRSSQKPVVSVSSASNYINSGQLHPIRFTIDQSGEVTVRIKDEKKNAVVSTIIINKPYSAAGTYTVYWDARDSSGKAVPSGKYNIFVVNKNWAGMTGYQYKALTYTDDLKPTISATSTYTKNSDNKYQIIFRTKFDCKLTVRVSNSAGNTVRNIAYKVNSSKGGHAVYWDGKDNAGKVLPSGKYSIVVIEYDNYGNSWYTKHAFNYTLAKTPTIASNSRYPKTSNNRHLIKLSIAKDAKVSVVIRDESGKSIRYLAYKQDFEAGQHNLYWDGKDSKNKVVPSDIYYIYAIQYDETSKYTYSKKKLAVEISEKPTISSNSYFTRTGTNRHLIKVDIATPAKVSTRIMDANLKSVIYLEYKVSHEDGRFYLYWDGKTKSGNDVPDGIYYIDAIQYKTDGSYTYARKKIALN